jgi:hypothetical protein
MAILVLGFFAVFRNSIEKKEQRKVYLEGLRQEGWRYLEDKYKDKDFKVTLNGGITHDPYGGYDTPSLTGECLNDGVKFNMTLKHDDYVPALWSKQAVDMLKEDVKSIFGEKDILMDYVINTRYTEDENAKYINYKQAKDYVIQNNITFKEGFSIVIFRDSDINKEDEAKKIGKFYQTYIESFRKEREDYKYTLSVYYYSMSELPKSFKSDGEIIHKYETLTFSDSDELISSKKLWNEVFISDRKEKKAGVLNSEDIINLFNK